MYKWFLFSLLLSPGQANHAAKMSLAEHVLKDENDRLVGLLVHRLYAMKFLSPEPHRKVYELRKNQCKSLNEGDKIALVAIAPKSQDDWLILGILEFVGNVKIKPASLDKYFHLHQVHHDDLANYVDFTHPWVWAWHFELVQSFDPFPTLTKQSGPVIFVHFGLGDIDKGNEDWSL